MKAISKRLLLATLGAGLIAVLTLLALWLSGGGSTHAQAPIILAIDMDPTGNSCPGDGIHDCTVGSIERCVSVPNTPGTTFTIDALVKGLWNGHMGWHFSFAFPDTTGPANLTLTSETLCYLPVNLIVQTGPMICEPDTPDALSPHTHYIGSFSGQGTPPWTQGVESRMTFQVGAGAVSGLYGFYFVPGTYQVLDIDLVDYNTTSGITVLDSNSPTQYGLVALGIPCPPSADLVGGLAELPDVASDSGWSTGAYAALAGGIAAVVLFLTAGAWYARRRWSRG